MRKILIAILLGGMLPINLGAHLDEENFFPFTEMEDMKEFENHETLPSLSEMVVTISDGRKAILSQIHPTNYHDTSEADQENTKQGTLLTREFAVYLLLQEMQISFSNQDTSLFSEEEGFSDLDSDSFFTLYILFAKKLEILKGYDDGSFRPKNLITQDEFQKILHHTFNKDSEKIFSTYNDLKTKNEEKLLLFSAGLLEEKTSLHNAHALVKNIVPFEYTKWYEALEDEEKILLQQYEDGEIYFPKIENISEYTLYFDYSGIPFLSKKTHSLMLSEVQEKIANSVNIYRQENHIVSVKRNETLDKIAENYAQQMFETKNFSHRDVNGKNVGDRALEAGYNYMIVLENIGKGSNIETLMQKWKESFTHNQNLLNTDIEEVGIGFYGNYWVQIFGKQF